MDEQTIWLMLYIYFYVVDILLLFVVVNDDRKTLFEKIVTIVVLLIPFVSIGAFFILIARIRKDLKRR